jgi:hypothetical protein
LSFTYTKMMRNIPPHRSARAFTPPPPHHPHPPSFSLSRGG